MIESKRPIFVSELVCVHMYISSAFFHKTYFPDLVLAVILWPPVRDDSHARAPISILLTEASKPVKKSKTQVLITSKSSSDHSYLQFTFDFMTDPEL